MEYEKLDKSLQAFWDDSAKGLKPVKITLDEIIGDDLLTETLRTVALEAPKVLDLGCGLGELSIMTGLLSGDKCEVLGLDTSGNSIEFAKEAARLSGLKKCEFRVLEEEGLEALKGSSFDAVICSNVLDVVTPVTSLSLIDNVKRLLRKGGTFLLKVNFYLSEDIVKRTKAETPGNDCYLIDGVLRSYNKPDKFWIDAMKPLRLVSSGPYERIPGGPSDRVFVFKKTK